MELSVVGDQFVDPHAFCLFNMEQFLDQRANVKFMVTQGKSQADTLRCLHSVYGESTMSKSQCQHWYLRFKAGDLTMLIKDAA